MVQMKINRGRHTDHPAGRHSIRTDHCPPPLSPIDYATCLSCRNPPTLSWLGTGTKYAGLHTQWRFLVESENEYKTVAVTVMRVTDGCDRVYGDSCSSGGCGL